EARRKAAPCAPSDRTAYRRDSRRRRSHACSPASSEDALIVLSARRRTNPRSKCTIRKWTLCHEMRTTKTHQIGEVEGASDPAAGLNLARAGLSSAPDLSLEPVEDREPFREIRLWVPSREVGAEFRSLRSRAAAPAP